MFGKKEWNMRTLQAREQAYGRKLDLKTMIIILGEFPIIITVFGFLLSDNFFYTAVASFISIVYSYIYVLPKEIYARYEQRVLDQHRTFINSITSSLSDPNEKVNNALNFAVRSLAGEFKSDVYTLDAVVMKNGSAPISHTYFTQFKEKYRGNPFFTDFMTLLEDANTSGDVNYGAFDGERTQFNDSYNRNLDFLKSMQNWHVQTLAVIGTVLLVFCIIIFTGGGNMSLNVYGQFARVYAHTFVGYGVNTLILILFWIAMHLFYKHYYDRDITAVSRNGDISKQQVKRRIKVHNRQSKKMAKQSHKTHLAQQKRKRRQGHHWFHKKQDPHAGEVRYTRIGKITVGQDPRKKKHRWFHRDHRKK